MKKTLIIALAAATALGAAALAAPAFADWNGKGGHGGMMGGMMGGGHGGMMGGQGGPFLKLFQELDADKDGTLTAAELDAGVKARYAEANTDGAEGVTLEEFTPWFFKQQQEMAVRAFQRLDSDGDGKVTEAEATEMATTAFSHMDRNGDGALSRDDRGYGRDGHGKRRGWFMSDDEEAGEDDSN